jgi:signal transduction histidine kinase
MTLGTRRVSAVSILVGLVMLLLPALAWMQYQWLGQLSEAERERMQRTLRTAAAQFANEFDTELSRTLINLQIDGQSLQNQNWSAYAQRYSAWVSSTSEPRLVRDVWLVDTLPGTTLAALDGGLDVPAEKLRIRRWSAQAMAFEAAEWPEDLAGLRSSLASRFIGFQAQRSRSNDNNAHREAIVNLTIGSDTTLISPVTLVEMPHDHPGPPRISILGFTIVRLDPAVIRDSMLTMLMARHFDANDSEVSYRVAVVQRDNPATVVWESESGAAQLVISAPDVAQSFMGPRPDQMLVFARGIRDNSRDPETGKREPGIPPPPPPRDRIPDPGSRIPTPESKVIVSMVEREDRMNGGRIVTRAGQLSLEGKWILMAKHRAGSLEAAVAAVRLRNLVISSGVLALLALAVGLIVVSTRRAQALARQQMEFVAAVSHELRTPVSVIGAAAGNLADGVVGDPQRVRKYGETIQGEARRLAETVERVLQLAGIAAGRAAAAHVPISPADLVNESLGAVRQEIDTAAFEVEVAVAENLPNVAGDATALRSALQNLISNAVKYGGQARWIRVTARLDPGVGARQQVVFAVEDRGLGIDAEDRKHVFEAFYRGRDAVSQQIQGSGLGLNLVLRIAEAHGGNVSVMSEPGKGSTFTLSLPAVHDRASTTYVEAGLQTRPSA